MTAITFEHVGIRIRERPILSDVTFIIERGEFVGVLGPNGAGKTKIMRAVLGVLRSSTGIIQVLDEPVRRGNPAVGYTPQVRSSLAHLRIRGWDFVASVSNGHRWGLPWLSSADRKNIEWAIELVDAQKLAQRPLVELSGGERQRLLLAQALVGKPELLLLDEPLISLDPRHQQVVIDLVRNLQRDLGMTVLFSAHDINPLLGALDRVLYLGGTHAALGTVEEVITGPVLTGLYGSEIEVIHLHGRIFVLSSGHDLERDEHRHDVPV